VVSPSVTGHLLETEDQLIYDFGGGGGWGDPLQRESWRVLDDVWDEYVSIEGARFDYGVVISGSLDTMDLAIDEVATAALRSELLQKRGGAS
jgi:N-methylhydantoinase B